MSQKLNQARSISFGKLFHSAVHISLCLFVTSHHFNLISFIIRYTTPDFSSMNEGPVKPVTLFHLLAFRLLKGVSKEVRYSIHYSLITSCSVDIYRYTTSHENSVQLGSSATRQSCTRQGWRGGENAFKPVRYCVRFR